MSFATTASGTFAVTRSHNGLENSGPMLDRPTRCPSLGLALLAGGVFWAGLGSTRFLLLA